MADHEVDSYLLARHKKKKTGRIQIARKSRAEAAERRSGEERAGKEKEGETSGS